MHSTQLYAIRRTLQNPHDRGIAHTPNDRRRTISTRDFQPRLATDRECVAGDRGIALGPDDERASWSRGEAIDIGARECTQCRNEEQRGSVMRCGAAHGDVTERVNYFYSQWLCAGS